MTSAFERKQAIRKASEEAQIDMRRLDREKAAELLRIYEQAADEMRLIILDVQDRGTIQPWVLTQLIEQIEFRMTQLSNAMAAELTPAMMEAAQLGAAAGLAAYAPDLIQGAAVAALEYTQTFIAKDGLQLSDRLWRLDAMARQAMQETIRRNVVLGNSASQAAREFIQRGASVPASIRSQVELADANHLGNVAAEAIHKKPGSLYSHALRVMRTEINRSHGEAYRNGLRAQEDIIAGEQFTLSPLHPEFDECDMHSTVDLHGLGPGVYPVGRSPWPAHPNTLSFLVAVFRDEVEENATATDASLVDWLLARSESEQLAILKSKSKRQALIDGVLRDDEILTPWYLLRPELIARGYTPDERAA